MIKNSLTLFRYLVVKKQYFFSIVLATLSFIAARKLQQVGVESYYIQKATNFQKEDGYFDLGHPNAIHHLPMGITPFSDVAMLDSTQMLGLDQEAGNLFLFDLNENTITSQLSLGETKFTDMAMVDSTVVLLDASNQVHFLLPPYDSLSFETAEKIDEDIVVNGACLHNSTKRLFFLGEAIEKGEGLFTSSIYTYNLHHRKMNETTLFDVNTSDIETFASENNITLPVINVNALGDSISGLQFVPSAIAVHPKTNEIYILSSGDKSLVVYDQFGKVVNFTFLDPNVFTAPTGLTFLSNGDLLISNKDLMTPSVMQVKWNRLLQSKSGHGLIFGR